MNSSSAPDARAATAPQRDRSISSRLSAIKEGGDTSHGLQVLEEVHREVGIAAAALNARLLGTALQWTQADKDAAAEMGVVHHDLARAAHRLAVALTAAMPESSGAMQRAAAIALHATGDALKSDAVAGRAVPTDYGRLHALMREAITRSGHRAALSIPVAGQPAACTLEALYFRALLLARFGGTLNSKQIEILDTWIWMWLPVLESTSQPPEGAALRADLDSSAGLSRGPRGDAGPSLYLPQGPIENAYRSLLREFQNGHIVPSGSLAATFRVEEHVAVLDLIRDGLKESRAEPVARAPRRPGGLAIELLLGLNEIGTRGHGPGGSESSAVSLATSGGAITGPKRREREHDVALAEIYEPVRRNVRVLDQSDSGFCIEGALGDCGQVSVRDLVGARLHASGPLVIGRVARVAPDTRGMVRIGVKRLSAASRAVEAVALDEPGGALLQLLFVPGGERSGTQDGFLLSEAQFARNSRIEVTVETSHYVLRFNRVRERGRGWVLAGFVVVDVLPATRSALA